MAWHEKSDSGGGGGSIIRQKQSAAKAGGGEEEIRRRQRRGAAELLCSPPRHAWRRSVSMAAQHRGAYEIIKRRIGGSVTQRNSGGNIKKAARIRHHGGISIEINKYSVINNGSASASKLKHQAA